ncbi:MAG: hypothetical protein RBT36_10165 [Desulfobulbus sp.]|nr:hypothetical protein [Desulfobulbus sp.]
MVFTTRERKIRGSLVLARASVLLSLCPDTPLALKASLNSEAVPCRRNHPADKRSLQRQGLTGAPVALNEYEEEEGQRPEGLDQAVVQVALHHQQQTLCVP